MNRQIKRKIERNLSSSCDSKLYEYIKDRIEKQMEVNPNYFSELANKRLYNLMQDTTILDVELEYLHKGE